MKQLNAFSTDKKYHKFTTEERMVKELLGYTILKFRNNEYAVDLLSDASMESFKKFVNNKTGKVHKWFKERRGNKNWVLYNIDDFFVDKNCNVNFLHYIGNGESFEAPINVSSCFMMFMNHRFAYKFSFPEDIDFSNVVDMSKMFFGAIFLKNPLTESFSTVNVENMHGMFMLSKVNKRFKLPESFDTSSVKDMSHMFSGFIFYKDFKFPNKFTFKKVLYASNLFAKCVFENGFSFDERFSTKNIERMDFMFHQTIFKGPFHLPESFDTSSCRYMNDMFSNSIFTCGLYFPETFNTENVINFSRMFYGCEFPRDFKLPKAFNMINKIHYAAMFDFSIFPTNDYLLNNLGISQLSAEKIVERLKRN